MNTDLVVALDVGGTSVKSAIVTNHGEMVGGTRKTPIDSQGAADAILETFASIVRSHLLELDGQSVLGVGVGFPGPFEYETGVSRIQGVAKYEAILGVNVGDAIRQRLKLPELPIRFRNDAEAAIVGEGVFGAGKPFSRVIGVTLGTGCGSAFLVNGRSVTTGAGVPANGWLYPIPFNGQPADDIFSIRGLMGRLLAAGVDAPDIKTAAEWARHEHIAARQAFTQFGQDLGAFLEPWVDAFQADAVLVQGGIANAFNLFEDTLKVQLPDVVRGELSSRAALLGAAALFFQSE